MSTPVNNFADVEVDGLYDDNDLSVDVVVGGGSRFPSTFPFPATWWNATDYPNPADDPNREIVSVTAISTNTLTIVRAQEGTSASTKNTGGKTYRLCATITKAILESLRVPTQIFKGLQLQTARDSDIAAKTVELVDVESIIMDDGVELLNDSGQWSGKIADITVSGAGGLDTGTEHVSSFYEIYAIAKEDGTRNLLLHKSKVWATETNYVTSDSVQGIRSDSVSNGNIKIAQGFMIGTSGDVMYIEAKLKRFGSPTGNIWFTIETDSATQPSGTVLATTAKYDVSRIPVTETTMRLPIKSPVTLSATTQYHLVAQGDWTVHLANYIGWSFDSVTASYANGALARYDSDGGGAWTTNTGHDAVFAIGTEIDDAAVTMPAGYTKKCFLGWVFNDGDGNFLSFYQVERRRVSGILTDAYNLVWSMSGDPELIGLQGALPPRRIVNTIIGLTGTGTSGSIVAIGDLRAGDIEHVGGIVGAQTVMGTAITTTAPSVFRDVMVEMNAIMVKGTASASLYVTGWEW